MVQRAIEVAIFLNDYTLLVYVPGRQTEERRFRAGETLYAPGRKPLAGELGWSPHRDHTRRTERVIRETPKRMRRGWCPEATSIGVPGHELAKATTVYSGRGADIVMQSSGG